MNIELLRQYDAIRPFEPEELPEVYERLVANSQFRAVAAAIFPDIPFETLAERMRACRTNLDFQRTFCYPFLSGLLAKASSTRRCST